MQGVPDALAGEAGDVEERGNGEFADDLVVSVPGEKVEPEFCGMGTAIGPF